MTTNTNWEHYWRNVIILIVILLIPTILIHLKFDDGVDCHISLTVMGLMWAVFGLSTGLITIVKNWYDGYPLAFGHIIQTLFSTFLGPIIAFATYQFGIRKVSEHYYDRYNTTWIISHGRKTARILRILSQ